MSDQDKITKKQATKALDDLCGYTFMTGSMEKEKPGVGQYLDAIEAEKAIDALKPVAEVQDAVSRDDVKQIREKCVRYIEEITHSARSIDQLLDALIEFSPSVLPAKPQDKPDYEAMIEELQEVFETELGDDTRWLQREVEDRIDEVIAKHTPRPDEGTKPEGQDEETQT